MAKLFFRKLKQMSFSYKSLQTKYKYWPQGPETKLIRSIRQDLKSRGGNRDLKIHLFNLQNAEKAMATHSSTFAWNMPWMEEPGRLQSMGLLRVRHD